MGRGHLITIGKVNIHRRYGKNTADTDADIGIGASLIIIIIIDFAQTFQHNYKQNVIKIDYQLVYITNSSSLFFCFLRTCQRENDF